MQNRKTFGNLFIRWHQNSAMRNTLQHSIYQNHYNFSNFFLPTTNPDFFNIASCEKTDNGESGERFLFYFFSL